MAWMRVECGVGEEEFWKMTPAKISALIDARKAQIKREDYRAGIITATIRAALGAKNVDVFDDFPEYKVKKKKANSKQLLGLFRAMVDKDKPKTAADGIGEKPSGA